MGLIQVEWLLHTFLKLPVIKFCLEDFSNSEYLFIAAFVSDQFFITSYPDKPKIDYGFFIKRPPLGEAIKRLEKVSAWEPKVMYY